MLQGLRGHFRNNVVGYVALFLALGLGTAWAAGLEKNSVKSKHIKNGKVKSVDIADDDVRGADVLESSLGKIPNATRADSSGHATTASSATTAANANNLDGMDSAEFAPADAEPWHEVGTDGEPQFQPANGDSSSGNCEGAPDGCEWANYTDGQHNSAAFYRDPFGEVHLKGLVCRAYVFNVWGCPPSVSGAGLQVDDIFQLPAGYRPGGIIEVAGSSAGLYARVEIKPDGTVSAAPPYNYGNLYLDNISFRCAPAGVAGCP